MVSHDTCLKDCDIRIKMIEKAAAELIEIGKANGIPAVYKNAKRIAASVNILKLEISDLLDLEV